MKIDADKDLWQYLATAQKPIVLYGMGNGADKVLDRLQLLGIEAAGVSADLEKYAGQLYRDIREILARIKDFGLCILN